MNTKLLWLEEQRSTFACLFIVLSCFRSARGKQRTENFLFGPPHKDSTSHLYFFVARLEYTNGLTLVTIDVKNEKDAIWRGVLQGKRAIEKRTKTVFRWVGPYYVEKSLPENTLKVLPWRVIALRLFCFVIAKKAYMYIVSIYFTFNMSRRVFAWRGKRLNAYLAYLGLMVFCI